MGEARGSRYTYVKGFILMKGSWASVDPGETGTGVALWSGVKKVPVAFFPLRCKNQKEYMYHIKKIFVEYEVKYCVIEEATYFQGSLKGEVSTKSGSTFKLSRFIGALQMMCDFLYITHELVLPMTWKGQLPKTVTIKRIQELLPNIELSEKEDHVYDAIGIGLHKLGVF